MKRRILLVDDEVAVLLTMKAVLEISGFDVDTAASAREAKAQLHKREYHMIITDMRMESEASGQEVIEAARTAPYQPAIALLTAFPVDEGDWQGLGADQLLLKPVHTRILLEQIEKLFVTHEQKLAADTIQAPAANASAKEAGKPVKKSTKSTKKSAAQKPVGRLSSTPKTATRQTAAKKSSGSTKSTKLKSTKKAAKKPATKRS